MLINYDRPLVSICCLTYNHVNYIEKCLDSLINQKTNFPYEILVNDDGSIDGTIQILKYYETKYPKIVFCTYQRTNQFKRGENNLIDVLFKIARGKYLATCDGDDFWISENKLQIQIDFLEENKEYSFVGSSVFLFNSNNEKIGEYPSIEKKNNFKINKNYFFKFPYNIIPHSTLVHKNNDYFNSFNIHNYPMGDLPMITAMLSKSDAYFINKNLAGWRIHKNSSWANKHNKESIKKSILAFKLLGEDFNIKEDLLDSIIKYLYYDLSKIYAIDQNFFSSFLFWIKSLNYKGDFIPQNSLKRLKYICYLYLNRYSYKSKILTKQEGVFDISQIDKDENKKQSF